MKKKKKKMLTKNVIEHIYSFLEARDIGVASRVSKVWYRANESCHRWKELFEKDFEEEIEKCEEEKRVWWAYMCRVKKNEESWREKYVKTLKERRGFEIRKKSVGGYTPEIFLDQNAVAPNMDPYVEKDKEEKLSLRKVGNYLEAMKLFLFHHVWFRFMVGPKNEMKLPWR